jgi:hypothetical protein
MTRLIEKCTPFQNKLRLKRKIKISDAALAGRIAA